VQIKFNHLIKRFIKNWRFARYKILHISKMGNNNPSLNEQTEVFYLAPASAGEATLQFS
jgi:hypothetical protein